MAHPNWEHHAQVGATCGPMHMVQWPQGGDQATTWSPSARLVTPSPTAVMMPAPSWPRTAGRAAVPLPSSQQGPGGAGGPDGSSPGRGRGPPDLEVVDDLGDPVAGVVQQCPHPGASFSAGLVRGVADCSGTAVLLWRERVSQRGENDVAVSAFGRSGGSSQLTGRRRDAGRHQYVRRAAGRDQQGHPRPAGDGAHQGRRHRHRTANQRRRDDRGCTWPCLQAGAYITPINHHLVADEIAYIVEDSEAKVPVGPRALRQGDRQGGRPDRLPPPSAASPSATSRLPAFSSSRASPTRFPRSARPARPCTTSSAPPPPQGVKRPVVDIDPDVFGELFAGFQMFSITRSATASTARPRHTTAAALHGQLCTSATGDPHGQVDARGDARADRQAKVTTATWCRHSSTGCSPSPTT